MLLRLITGLPLVILLFPIWLMIFLLSLLNELGYALTGPILALFRKPGKPDVHVQKNATIAILNWNGRQLMEECLPSVIEAVEQEGGDHEILVIDNGSSDDSIAFLNQRYPQVRVVCLNKNYGFVEGYNRGIREARKDILVFLNNDMAVKKGFLRPLLDGFQAADVFAVSAQIHFWDPNRRREETGKTRTHWHKGFLAYRHDPPTEQDLGNRYVPAFWLGGGSAAVDRRKFLELGGFEPLLSPFYMEDVDLSYKAWKRGWRVLFCPESEVIHKHRSSSGRLDRGYVERVIGRNRLLFIWENITQPSLFLEHLIYLLLLPLRKSWEPGYADTIKIIWSAFLRLPQALWKRNRFRLHARLRDSEIFRIANATFAYKEKYVPPAIPDPRRLKILIVSPYFPATRSGGGVRMNKMIHGLSQQHEVSLLSFWDEETDLEYFEEMERVCKRFKAIRRRPVPPRSYIPVLPPALEIEFGDPEFHQALEEMLEEDYSIVQAEYLLTALQIPQSKRYARVITHHEVHNAATRTRIDIEKSALKKTVLQFQWARWLNAEISLCEQFDQVVALTPEDAWDLYRFAPRLPLNVIQTGIDLDYFHPHPASQEEPDSLIFVGNFRHPPNVDSAFFLVNEVLPLVRQEIPGVKLYLVGANPPYAVQKLARPGEVVVTGWVDDMRPYIQRACVYVFPIRIGVGLRNKILEAWAMGKPTITTRLGSAGLKAAHQENIWLAESANDFAEGICALLKNPLLREKLGSSARTYVEERHAWQTVTDKYIDVYWKALREKGIVS